MKRFIEFAAILALSVILFNCGTVPLQKDKCYIPVYFAQASTGSIENAQFDQGTKSFSNISDLSTAVFYKAASDPAYKKQTANSIMLLSTIEKEVKKFYPNTENVLVLKTGFEAGWDLTMILLTSFMETAYPNKYEKDINFDLNALEASKDKGEYLNADFALLAINVGNSVIRELTIIDIVPAFVEIVGSSFATDDLFVPLNTELARLDKVEHKFIENDNKKILVFHVFPKAAGIKPSEMVEIKVSVKIKKSDLMKPEYKVK